MGRFKRKIDLVGGYGWLQMLKTQTEWKSNSIVGGLWRSMRENEREPVDGWGVAALNEGKWKGTCEWLWRSTKENERKPVGGCDAQRRKMKGTCGWLRRWNEMKWNWNPKFYPNATLDKICHVRHEWPRQCHVRL